jgi:hypothetical protein
MMMLVANENEKKRCAKIFANFSKKNIRLEVIIVAYRNRNGIGIGQMKMAGIGMELE